MFLQIVLFLQLSACTQPNWMGKNTLVRDVTTMTYRSNHIPTLMPIEIRNTIVNFFLIFLNLEKVAAGVHCLLTLPRMPCYNLL